ncbi:MULTISPECIES: MarR family transcriptional regulator [unclassified Streptomyces]|uniref:MarR family transcriptional regulator n=1 Tax=unclassified Streptomyces TaxID=2593676 RepID=UPI0007ED747B|nr:MULTISPECIES: MarR family transcriptional regulator [unclassified Streptomyces]MCP3767516.1 MarR family transcriptional regulator [Streptomyces sp. MAR25Y5]OBQ53543.1 MarR family transcriptional regulator [Streptomyces sp. H-KF8]
MNAQTTPSSPGPGRAAEVACEVVELLEVLWDRGREAAPVAPVSASQLRVLYSLERERGINLRTLGEMLGSSPPSVSRLCDRLEALGFVRRTPSPVSRRELMLDLTGSGAAYLSELRLQREEVLRSVIESMSPESRTALRDGLGAFRDAVERGALIPGTHRVDRADRTA